MGETTSCCCVGYWNAPFPFPFVTTLSPSSRLAERVRSREAESLAGPLASLMRSVRPWRLSPLPAFWPSTSARCMSLSSAKRTKP